MCRNHNEGKNEYRERSDLLAVQIDEGVIVVAS